MNLRMTPLRLHDTGGGVYWVAEKDVAQLVRHYATQKNGKACVSVIAVGATSDLVVVNSGENGNRSGSKFGFLEFVAAGDEAEPGNLCSPAF